MILLKFDSLITHSSVADHLLHLPISQSLSRMYSKYLRQNFRLLNLFPSMSFPFHRAFSILARFSFQVFTVASSGISSCHSAIISWCGQLSGCLFNGADSSPFPSCLQSPASAGKQDSLFI